MSFCANAGNAAFRQRTSLAVDFPHRRCFLVRAYRRAGYLTSHAAKGRQSGDNIFRGGLRLWRDSVSRSRRTDQQHDLPLPDLPASRRVTCCRLGHVPNGAISTASRASDRVSFIGARASRFLFNLWDSLDVRAQGFRRLRRHHDL